MGKKSYWDKHKVLHSVQLILKNNYTWSNIQHKKVCKQELSVGFRNAVTDKAKEWKSNEFTIGQET